MHFSFWWVGPATGEMFEWFRALVAVLEAPSSVPSFHVGWLTTVQQGI